MTKRLYFLKLSLLKRDWQFIKQRHEKRFIRIYMFKLFKLLI